MGENKSDMKRYEISGNEIRAEDIMARIRENIRRRNDAAEIPHDPDSMVPSAPIIPKSSSPDEQFRRDLSYLNSNCDIRNNGYSISSHRFLTGKLFIKGRQLVHGEIRRYVDPVISNQTEFNISSARIITRVSQWCTEIDRRQRKLVSAFTSFRQESGIKFDDLALTADAQAENLTLLRNELTSAIEKSDKEQVENLTLLRNELVAEIETMIQEYRNKLDQTIYTSKSDLNIEFAEKFDKMVLTNRSELNARIDDLLIQMDKEIHAKTWLAQALEDRMHQGLAKEYALPSSAPEVGSSYFLFEEKFRGSREDIKQRQLTFIPYFEKCSHVLDIGCGRGEFLEILKNHGIGGIGVDIDPDMIAYCLSRNLDVTQSDAISFLEGLEDKCLDGIFIDQVVEHLEPEYLILMLSLCYRKLKFGYYIIVETVNPLSFVSFANFYIDLTHRRPVHPETLQYLFTASGFRECEKKFLSPVSDEGRLKKVGVSDDMKENERNNIELYNRNVEMLNGILFGAQDYVIIGKK